MTPSFASLLLFPSFEHHRFSVGSYGHVVAAEEVSLTRLPLWRLDGVEVGWRHFTEESFDLDGPLDSELSLDPDLRWETTGSETPASVRLYLDRDGTIAIDRLHLGSALLGLTIRQPLGDMLDLSLIGHRWESTVAATDTGRFQLRGIVPSELTLVGLSNTDFDEDKKLKYYIAVGTGLGGEVLGRVLGPLGVYGRALGRARTFNRHQGDGAPNQVRHELHGEVEAGVALFGQREAFWLSGFGELTSQHETRDAGGKDGVDRQYVAWGIRLNARLSSGGSSLDARKTDTSGPTQL